MTAIADLNPRRDLSLIRDRILSDFAAGVDVGPALAGLGDRDPVALADVLVGAHAPSSAAWVREAIRLAPVLETALAPNGLYGRLATLHSETAIEVLEAAARRHPAGSWIVTMSRKIEGHSAGHRHLTAALGHPSFTQNCWAHAQAGHLPGLIMVAGETGRPEPASALAAHGHLEAAGLAIAETLTHSPRAPVVAMVAAAWGPDATPVLHQALQHLRSRATAQALLEQARGYSAFSSMLETVIRAMVQS